MKAPEMPNTVEEMLAQDRAQMLSDAQVDLNEAMERYASIASLEDHPGWVALMEMCSSEIERLRVTLETPQESYLFRYAQGALKCFRWLASIPQLAEASKQAVTDQQRILDQQKQEYIDFGDGI